jgi:hypothetical protein
MRRLPIESAAPSATTLPARSPGALIPESARATTMEW